LLAARVASVFFTNCAQPIISSTGDVYNLTRYNNTLLIYDDIKTSFRYNVTLCTNGMTGCGWCPASGYCEAASWFSTCVGQFAAIQGLPDGSGIEILYNNGELTRTGIVQLQCDATVPGLVVQGIADNGNLFIVKGEDACPSGKTTPPVEPSASCQGLIQSPTGENYNLSGYIGTLLSAFAGQSRLTVSICDNAVHNCGGCGSAGACLTTSQTVCEGMFNGTQALANGQGIILNYVGGDFGFSTQVVLKCDPTSVDFWNVKIQVTSQNDVMETQGLGGCQVGTQFIPFGFSPTPPSSASPSPVIATPPTTSDAVSTFDTLVSASLIIGLILLAAAVILLIVLLVLYKRRPYDAIPSHQ